MLFDLDARPVFPHATVFYEAGDDDHFVLGQGRMREHIRRGFADGGRTRPIGRDTVVAPGITAVLAAGHAPGHLCAVLSSERERALLLGDAVTCPVQLDEASRHSMGDVDPALADRTRERLWRELEDPATVGVGRTPELRFGRVLTGAGATGRPERGARARESSAGVTRCTACPGRVTCVPGSQY